LARPAIAGKNVAREEVKRQFFLVVVYQVPLNPAED